MLSWIKLLSYTITYLNLLENIIFGWKVKEMMQNKILQVQGLISHK